MITIYADIRQTQLNATLISGSNSKMQYHVISIGWKVFCVLLVFDVIVIFIRFIVFFFCAASVRSAKSQKKCLLIYCSAIGNVKLASLSQFNARGPTILVGCIGMCCLCSCVLACRIKNACKYIAHIFGLFNAIE